MKPEWSARAYRELRGIERYMVGDFGQEVAWQAVNRILETVDLLEANPYLGRQAEWRGHRELVVDRYVIVYSVHRSGVRVHSVTHGAQRK